MSTDPTPGALLREQIRHIWLDFQQMERFEKDPLVVVEAEGLRVRTDDGREFVDAIGGAIVSTLGYGHPRMRKAIAEAAGGMDFWPVLHSTTPSAIRLAARLSELLPGDLNTSFLLTGGSEATETAMKMARQYHRQNDQPLKFKVISRYWSYHGATRGALSASGVGDRRRFEPLDGSFLHVLPPYCYRCPWGKSPDSCSLECAETVAEVIRYEGRETVASVIADPVMMAAGVIAPPKQYFERLREICDRNGVLLIFDEVATGFGKTGEMFAANYFDTLPDIICLGKGLSSGYAPVAAVVARDHIVEAFRGDEEKKFLHGHTFGGYPLGNEVALEAIATLIEEDLVANARDVGEYLGESLRALAESNPEIGDVRGVGVLWGLEFVRDRETKERFPRGTPLAAWTREAAMSNGLITRGSDDVIVLSPALIITKGDVDLIVGLLETSIEAARARLKSA